MKGIFLKNNFFLFLIIVLIYILFGIIFEIKAACRGEGFMGVSSKDPIMSWVDLTFSPVYTSASTSGTSGCKNWDFPYEKYIEYVILKFINKSQKHLVVETVQGYGSHIEALSLMTCPESSSEDFNIMLRSNSKQAISIFSNVEKIPNIITQLKKWIKDSPALKEKCFLS